MSAISGLGQSAAELSSNYLNLLVTQLQNQNPLEPMDNNQMASQLAQLGQLGQTEQMNSTFQKVLLSTELTQANGLIGKQVSFMPDNASTAVQAKVSGVKVVDGQVQLTVGTYAVPLENIQTITN